MSRPFVHGLPPARLGISHPSLSSFYRSVYGYNQSSTADASPEIIDKNLKTDPFLQSQLAKKKKKEYTLIMVTESQKERILLGLKNRGFGTGFYNSFGGKIDPSDTSVAFGAMRELKEEANITVPLHIMEECHVGFFDFTFEDTPSQMIVHLFRVDISCLDGKLNDDNVHDANVILVEPNVIRPPEDGEITPKWFDSWYEIPLFQMFADDSIWIPKVLSEPAPASVKASSRKKLSGWFHYAPGGVETNTISHYHFAYC